MVSIIQIVIGGVVGLLKPFLRSDNEFANDVKLRKEVRVENVASRLLTVLEAVGDLRGDPPGKPDILGNAVREVFGAVEDFVVLDHLRGRYRSATTILLITAVAGFFFLLGSVILPSLRAAIGITVVAFIVIQAVAACFMRHWALKLETYQAKL